MECSIKEDKRQFRMRAAAIIVKDNKVLMSRNKRIPYYYSVGGAIELGESSEEAVIREVEEETAWKLEIDRLFLIHENFFQVREGEEVRDFHIVNFYYLMKTPENFELDPNWRSITLGDEEEVVEWVDLDSYESELAKPKFLAQLIRENPKEVRHIVTRDYF